MRLGSGTTCSIALAEEGGGASERPGAEGETGKIEGEARIVEAEAGKIEGDVGKVEDEVDAEAQHLGAEVRSEQSGLDNDRFRTWVAILIAGVSILGAMVAWRGALVANTAGQQDQTYIQELAEQRQEIALLTSRVDEDVRQVGTYAEHLGAAQVVQAQADAAQATDPNLANQLRLEAQSERTLAAERLRFITAGLPQITNDPKNPVKYNRDAALKDLEQRDGNLQKLHPDATLTAAKKLHGKSQYLVALVTLFVASLFFLTLAQFTGKGPQRIFARAGTAVAIVSILVWILVEVFA